MPFSIVHEYGTHTRTGFSSGMPMSWTARGFPSIICPSKRILIYREFDLTTGLSPIEELLSSWHWLVLIRLRTAANDLILVDGLMSHDGECLRYRFRSLHKSCKVVQAGHDNVVFDDPHA